MKTLIISDVHSNIAALEAIWSREQDADRVLCAGDVVDYGPYPADLPETHVVEVDGTEYGMTHAYQKYEIIRSLETFRAFCNTRFDCQLDRLIFGHTHRREVHYLADDTLWINPGSCSYRRRAEPDQRAQYAVIVDGQISLRAAEYPVEPLYRYAQQAPIVDSDKRHTLSFWGPRPWQDLGDG